MTKFADYLKNLRKSGQIYFTTNQAVDDLKISKQSTRSLIYRAKKQGDIISPARNFYIIIPPEHQSQGCLPAEELAPILMQHLGINYYVGLLSASLYYGASHQKPNALQIITNKQIQRTLKFGRIKIDTIYKKSLAGLPLQDRVVNTGYLKISSPELTAMDLLIYPKRSGGLNHIATVLAELVEAIDIDRLLELAQASKKNFWLQKLGYILEKIDTENEEHKQKIIDGIQSYLSSKKKLVALASEMPIKGYHRSKKWMIIENTTIESDLDL